ITRKESILKKDCSKWILFIYANMGVQEDLLINLFFKAKIFILFWFSRIYNFLSLKWFPTT
ncbi:hypothetical protein SB775_27140, partial [Peribacillus sp. SIMBA_075]|uniref:hypothetical protein n=1 Tax=Peribacillus sp. SIMBA_075 TaxID=3085813 RepID=UPI0039784FD9